MSKEEKDQGDWNVHIGGDINIQKGDFVGRDKNVSVESGGIHVEGDAQINQQAALQKELFESILRQIDQRPNTPVEDAADLKTNVEEFKSEAEKGDQADESFLARRLRNIERIAPDILEVLVATVANPAAGFALIVKKVAERAAKTQGSNVGG
jgi:hypothetical protein